MKPADHTPTDVEDQMRALGYGKDDDWCATSIKGCSDQHLINHILGLKRTRRHNVWYGINGHTQTQPRANALKTVLAEAAKRGLAEPVNRRQR